MNNQHEIILYQMDDTNVCVSVYYEGETFWLTTKAMAELFGVKTQAITKHLGNIGLFYVTACIGAFAVIALSVLIEYWSRDRVALHKSWLCWLGEKSYAIMAIHYPVKRRMVVIVAQAINAWHLYPITGLYTTFTSNHLLPSFIAFIFTMVITIIIAISAQSFTENAQFGHRKKERRDVEE